MIHSLKPHNQQQLPKLKGISYYGYKTGAMVSNSDERHKVQIVIKVNNSDIPTITTLITILFPEKTAASIGLKIL